MSDQPELPPVRATSGAEPRRSILVVDDERRIRDNLAILLRGGFHRVETVANGEAALVALTTEPFDLIITDIMMESGDGFSLLETVRERSPRTLVIVITGHGSMESTIRAMRMGAFDYLVKPFDFELLSLSVERAMKRVEAERGREQAEAELRRWSEQLQVINSIGRRAAATLTESDLLGLVARSLHEEFGYYHVYFAMMNVDGRRLVIRAQAGAYEGKMPTGYQYEPGTGITGKVVRTGRRVLVNDVRRDQDYIELMPQTAAQVALPIVVEGYAIGALSVESTEKGSFDLRDCTLLETLADMVASSIKTVRLFQEIKETKDYLEALVSSSADAIVTTDTKGIVTVFSPGAEQVYGYSAAEVVGKPVANFYAEGATEAEKVMDLLLKHDRLKNYETTLRAHDGRQIYASLSASLLKDRAGKTIGTLGVSKDITQRVELERQLKELTITDSLTGLYNYRHFRAKLSAEIERARRQNRDLMLMLFDVDRFKQYNDTHGHVTGDKLLREIGRRVSDSIRDQVDSGFRYGGDEFTIIFPDLGGEPADVVIRRIKDRIEKDLPDGVTISAGVVAFRAGLNSEEFLRLADLAMYEAKKGAAGRLVVR